MRPLHVGIPVFDEWPWLCETLADLAATQTAVFEVWVCVNQSAALAPDDPAAIANRRTLAWLRAEQAHFPFRLHVLDATGAAAPPADQAGVGWARRFLFAAIEAAVGADYIGVSLDADTRCAPGYLTAVAELFAGDATVDALSAPYRHPEPAEPRAARALLRYELYMRYYQLNLWRIGSPFAFTALGSNLAFRGRAYRRAGGFPVRSAGEDFYLLQQLCKTGVVAVWLPVGVVPAARVSQRVPFGTGPVLAQPDLALQETRFPFYDPAHFDLIGATYALWPRLHEADVVLPIDAFLRHRLKGLAPFQRMRRNFAGDRGRFVRACYERLDGLRLLQCLRFYREQAGAAAPDDAVALARGGALIGLDVPAFCFADVPLETLRALRRQWAMCEHEVRRRQGRIGLAATGVLGRDTATL